ncbi:hypothetical protein [Spirillospora sp. NPDC029432]|uniref:hypothetical protein n=1 Tax=Spirillospora sp. NPDC029432 TaxID=3154599 RepID=UPI0034567903
MSAYLAGLAQRLAALIAVAGELDQAQTALVDKVAATPTSPCRSTSTRPTARWRWTCCAR